MSAAASGMFDSQEHPQGRRIATELSCGPRRLEPPAPRQAVERRLRFEESDGPSPNTGHTPYPPAIVADSDLWRGGYGACPGRVRRQPRGDVLVACALEGRVLQDFDQTVAVRARSRLEEQSGSVRGRHGPSGRTSALPSGEAHGGLVAAAAIGTGGGRAVAHSVQDRAPGAGHGRRGGRRHPTLPPLRPALAPFMAWRRTRGQRGANASSAPSRVGRLLRGLRRALGRHPVLPLAPLLGPHHVRGSGERSGRGSRAPCRDAAARRGSGLTGGALFATVFDSRAGVPLTQAVAG